MTRKASIDIAKGLGICLVVLGHLIDYFDAELPGVYPYIYLFHVPLFFFLSGLFFKESEKFGDCVRKKFSRLYVPYLLANIFFFAVEMLRIQVLKDVSDGSLTWMDLPYAVFGLWPVPSMLSRPTWFILVLFRVFIIYKLMQLVFKGNKYLMFAVCSVAGVAGAFFPIEKYMIGQTLVALPFFSLGHMLAPGFVDNRRLFQPVTCAVSASVSAAALLILSRHQLTNMAVNVYGNVLLFFTGALLGIMMILWLSKLLEKWKVSTAALSFVGKFTLPILIWHIFVVKILFTIVEKFAGLRAGVVLYVVAFLAGILIPIGMSLCYKKFKSLK